MLRARFGRAPGASQARYTGGIRDNLAAVGSLAVFLASRRRPDAHRPRQRRYHRQRNPHCPDPVPRRSRDMRRMVIPPQSGIRVAQRRRHPRHRLPDRRPARHRHAVGPAVPPRAQHIRPRLHLLLRRQPPAVGQPEPAQPPGHRPRPRTGRISLAGLARQAALPDVAGRCGTAGERHRAVGIAHRRAARRAGRGLRAGCCLAGTRHAARGGSDAAHDRTAGGRGRHGRDAAGAAASDPRRRPDARLAPVRHHRATGSRRPDVRTWRALVACIGDVPRASMARCRLGRIRLGAIYAIAAGWREG
ncbi:hypothetical protein D3C72_1381030 [compost metagenome]